MAMLYSSAVLVEVSPTRRERKQKTSRNLSENPTGIGKGLVSQYLLQPSTTVIAGLRNPDSESAAQLKSLPSAEKSNLLIVKLDSTSNSDANDAITAIQQTHQIRHIDTVIANAGICDHLQLVANMEIDELARHIDTNVYGVLRLFQATWPILQNSASPKFVCVSSRMGSIGQAASDEGATGAYGLSKAATNFLVTKMAAENKGLIAFCVDPG